METINKLQSYEVYTNTQALNDLKVKARDNTKEALEPVAQQFESIFIEQILKENRKVKLDGGWLDGEKTDFYKDWHDKQLALSIAANGGIGLAKTIVEQLSPNLTPALDSSGNPASSPVSIMPIQKPVESDGSVVGILPVRKPFELDDPVAGILPIRKPAESASPVVGILPIQKEKNSIVGSGEPLRENSDMHLKLKEWYPPNFTTTDEGSEKTTPQESADPVLLYPQSDVSIAPTNSAKAWLGLSDTVNKKFVTNHSIMQQSLTERLTTQDQLRLRSLHG